LKISPGVSVAGSTASTIMGRYQVQVLSTRTSLDGLVAQAVSGRQRRSTICASDGDKDYRPLSYTMAAVRPSRASWMLNPSDLSLQSMMTQIMQKGYELIQSVQDEDTGMNQSCLDFLRDLPPPTFADMVIRGDPGASSPDGQG
jgi:hypothetical protein